MTELKISPKSRELRAAFFAQMPLAHVDLAAKIAETIVNDTVERLNEMCPTIGIHLLATALIARGQVSISAAWWAAEIAKGEAAYPDTYGTLLDIAINLPVTLDGETYNPNTDGRPGAVR